MRPPVALFTCIPCDMRPFLALRRTRSRPRHVVPELRTSSVNDRHHPGVVVSVGRP